MMLTANRIERIVRDCKRSVLASRLGRADSAIEELDDMDLSYGPNDIYVDHIQARLFEGINLEFSVYEGE